MTALRGEKDLVGARPRRRVAVVTSLLALVIGIGSLAIALPGLRGVGETVFNVAALFVAPSLAAVALVMLCRNAGVTPAARTAPILAASTAAFALAAMTRQAWSIGFDRADAGLPDTWFSALLWPLFAVAWAVGALAIALLVHAMMTAGGTSPTVGWATGVAVGLVAAPAIGIGLISPVPVMLTSAALVIFALRRPRARPAAD
ncbi:hypothetical protein [Microbacterium stercoris]|uniref:Uncharacterized protein n=1 Tax=Microbacterium stercoris TaxID=2820289 RepID=A0A939QIT5_9MICO|nr:hypothetical protein [Microbacterium stercoris]MBO3663633.1 hypothetical protein [Microbacterium stercoris]